MRPRGAPRPGLNRSTLKIEKWKGVVKMCDSCVLESTRTSGVTHSDTTTNNNARCGFDPAIDGSIVGARSSIYRFDSFPGLPIDPIDGGSITPSLLCSTAVKLVTVVTQSVVVDHTFH
jgi:hypothetical protein